jgi:hypothetical protein
MAKPKKSTKQICPSKEGAHYYVLPPAYNAVNGKITGICKRCGAESHSMLSGQPAGGSPSLISINSNKPFRRIK